MVSRWISSLAFALSIAACAGAPPADPVTPESGDATGEAGEAGAEEKKLSIKERVAQQVAAREEADRQAATVELPLERLSTAHIVVPMAVGTAEPMLYIVDTGASMTVITPQTRDALGIAPDEGMQVQAQGAGGSVGEPVRVVDLKDVRFGERTYDKMQAAVMDLAHLQEEMDRPIAGILGRNFLKRHDLEVDFVGSKIRFHGMGSRKREHSDALAGMIQIPYEEFEAGGLIQISAVLDGEHTLHGVFDLGAGRTVINWKAAGAAGVTPKSKGVKPSKKAAKGADRKEVKTSTKRFKKLELGEAVFDRPELHIADLPVFETLGVADGPAVVFGVSMLEGRTLLIDYEAKMLYLSR